MKCIRDNLPCSHNYSDQNSANPCKQKLYKSYTSFEKRVKKKKNRLNNKIQVNNSTVR